MKRGLTTHGDRLALGEDLDEGQRLPEQQGLGEAADRFRVEVPHGHGQAHLAETPDVGEKIL